MALLCCLIGHRPVFFLAEGAKVMLTARCGRCDKEIDLRKYGDCAPLSEKIPTSGEEVLSTAPGRDSSISRARARLADEISKARRFVRRLRSAETTLRLAQMSRSKRV